ncbi:MAG: glutamate--cysteine ligase [Gammaproteobacteria bacterium]|nr:glutamate--cysteine ligase [Gammaproteobacteria bacterium]
MSDLFDKRITGLNQPSVLTAIRGIRRGIEKESLRVTPDGHLAQTPHPQGLGSALTHPSITTDYSEALLEFITPAFTRIEDTLAHLEKTHVFTYQNMGDELLWVNSMPCIMGDDASIPIAQYGSSNIGRMKTIYRKGLGHRYGRLMQTISGIHYNFSFPEEFWQHYQSIEKDSQPLKDFTSEQYFHLIRNFQRFSPLLIYLFGASPAVCASFLSGRPHTLHQHPSSGTLYQPFATSLRMSDLGYQNDSQSDLHISYDSVQSYASALRLAMNTTYPAYKKISATADFQQLSSHILQIENEYYGQIRPKRNAESGERPTTALLKRGVEYIEMRCIDLNPFLDVGINAEQMRFLDIFAVYCLLQPSPLIDNEELRAIEANNQVIVLDGRNPHEQLTFNGEQFQLNNWAKSIWPKLEEIADTLDHAYNGQKQYQAALKAQYDKLEETELLPSSQILQQLNDNRINFYEFAMDIASQKAKAFRSRALKPADQAYYEKTAKASLEQQTKLESQSEMPFETYLQNYLNA